MSTCSAGGYCISQSGGGHSNDSVSAVSPAQSAVIYYTSWLAFLALARSRIDRKRTPPKLMVVRNGHQRLVTTNVPGLIFAQ